MDRAYYRCRRCGVGFDVLRRDWWRRGVSIHRLAISALKRFAVAVEMPPPLITEHPCDRLTTGVCDLVGRSRKEDS